MRSTIKKLTVTGLTAALAATAAVAVASPAEAMVPKGKHYFTTKKSGLAGAQGWGYYQRWSYKGKRTALVHLKIKDTAADNRKAAVQVTFTDHRYKDASYIYWNPSGRKGSVAQRTFQNYNVDHLYMRECRGTTYRSGGKNKFRITKCGGWRKFY